MDLRVSLSAAPVPDLRFLHVRAVVVGLQVQQRSQQARRESQVGASAGENDCVQEFFISHKIPL